MTSTLKKSRSDETMASQFAAMTTLKEDLYDEGSVDPVYQAKTRVLNQALQEIGMGKYQWALFAVAGFGWFSDSIWPLLTGLILSPVLSEFHFDGPFLSLAANIGLLVGALLWSFGCDIWGRKWSFNLTLFISSVFGIAAGGSPNFVALACLVAILGVGVGGNMPVDSAVFLDFVPGSHQYLLTVLSIWWALGQLLGSLVAWPLIANFSCLPTASSCTRAENMGWRYLLFTLGGLMFLLSLLRMFAFRLHESPRFLIGRGRDAEAVAVVHAIAAYNNVESRLCVEDLEEAAKTVKDREGANLHKWKVLSESSSWGPKHVKALFATPKLALSTSLLIALWGIIGLASTLYNNFLPYLFASRGARFDDATYYTTYRNQVILSITGIPGAFLAGWAIERPLIGRRGTLALSAGLTGAFLLASTTARSSPALLGWNCGYAFFSNIMYGVLYAISPELFPAKDRGTGNGLVSTATRVFGVVAPIIALYADINTSVPVYIAGALTVGAGALALLLPFEPRGKASI
ncbi:major facilitator superfamily [Heterobasidion irregulare TC 32-1]|uniref:Major facilitator superfamily n=1 Tax=Heterobasidion irregulare (strain TC 32-1) TaxID=747525 RepID=W4K1I6_HETIT|nr:major facilitator superfamily [Heterobasidion irregulare TC 32-1]ETW79672.1 major facilitator superfamily [Heterobasidion irregulare TC 32-1]